MIPPALPPEVHAGTAAAAAGVSPLLIIGGIAFMALWLVGAGMWAAASLIGGLMANDSGAVSSDKHVMLLLGMFSGEVLVALAGVAGGMAFFWSSHRGLMVAGFVGLLLAGVALQGWAFWSFSTAARVTGSGS